MLTSFKVPCPCGLEHEVTVSLAGNHKPKRAVSPERREYMREYMRRKRRAEKADKMEDPF
jgi:hypothetical protein